MMRYQRRFLIGIDEAGRGPLAGPVAVSAAMIPADFDWSLIPGVGDSKKISVKNREAIFHRAQELKRQGALDYAVTLVGNSTIDRINISRSVLLGVERALKRLTVHNPKRTRVLLDGLLHAPQEYTDQETITGGDGKEFVIGLASILAKVTRDRHMTRLSKKYPKYGFDIHKGYGTKLHRSRIKQYGLSEVHRGSFCTRIPK